MEQVAFDEVAVGVGEGFRFVGSADEGLGFGYEDVEPAPFEGDFVDGGVERGVEFADFWGWWWDAGGEEVFGGSFDPGDGGGPEFHHCAWEGGEEEGDGGDVEFVHFLLEDFAREVCWGDVLDCAAEGEETVEEVGHEVHYPAADTDELWYDFRAKLVLFQCSMHSRNGGENLCSVFDVEDNPCCFACK